MIPDKKQFKLYNQVVYRKKIYYIQHIYAPTPDAHVELVHIDTGDTITASMLHLNPIGYALIKKTRNGKFRYHTVSWNNERLQTSEPLDKKAHVIKMAKKYFSSFHIVDKTE